MVRPGTASAAVPRAPEALLNGVISMTASTRGNRPGGRRHQAPADPCQSGVVSGVDYKCSNIPAPAARGGIADVRRLR